MPKTYAWASALLLIGCRGPSEQQMAGAGLAGAALFALTSWALLVGVAQVWGRLRSGQWPAPVMRRGLLPVFLTHCALTIVAVSFADGLRDVGLAFMIWGFVAANHLAWSVIFWRLGGRLPVGTAVALASVPSLLIALPGALGNKGFAVAALVEWFWGGLLGLTPLVIILLVWLEAWLRRERPMAD